MKLKTLLLAATFAVFASANPAAYADEAHHPDAKAEKSDGKKPLKPHSHAEEKLGMPMPAPAEKQESAKQAAPAGEKHEHMMKHDHNKEKH